MAAEVTSQNFGLLVAYVLPGFLTILSLSQHSPTVQTWLAASSVADSPTVGGFLYITLASVATGMIVSVLRWLLLDSIHHHTGLRPPAWNFSTLQRNLSAFQAVVENHYRYYQFYGNTLVATLIFVTTRNPPLLFWPQSPILSVVTTLAILAVLFAASRDALKKYYDRAGVLLSLNT